MSTIPENLPIPNDNSKSTNSVHNDTKNGSHTKPPDINMPALNITDPDTMSSTEAAKSPFNIINSLLTFRNPDHQFWWTRTGVQLAQLLHHAGYDTASQYNELLFFALHIVPWLGPAPDADGHLRWHSPQTPDGTPLDLSWEWGVDGKGVIRTSFEPIGATAGGTMGGDVGNWFATRDWLTHLQTHSLVPSLDLTYYHHFTTHLLPPPPPSSSSPASSPPPTTTTTTPESTLHLSPQAGTFVTRDIDHRHNNTPFIKLYIFPTLLSTSLHTTNLALVSRALRALPAPSYKELAPSVEPLLQYLSEAARDWGMEIGILSVDLVDPKVSRIKIYTRAPNTSVRLLRDALSLGGRVSLPPKHVLVAIERFWRTFLGPACSSEEKEGGEEEEQRWNPHEREQRAGPGFYFTVKRGGGGNVVPKVYLCPGAFGMRDVDVVRGLRGWWEGQEGMKEGKGEGVMTEQMGRYEEALEGIYGQKFLEQQGNCHFYVSCALQKEQLRVVTYLCPQVLAREEEARKRKKMITNNDESNNNNDNGTLKCENGNENGDI